MRTGAGICEDFEASVMIHMTQLPDDLSAIDSAPHYLY